jgi:hypothetical protein
MAIESGLPPCGGCQNNPCECHEPIKCVDDPVNPDPNCCSVCTGDRTGNMFWEVGPPGHPGKCKLDLLTYAQVEHILRRVPAAREHLLKITNDPILRRMAYETKLVEPDYEDNARAAARINANTLPFYTALKGKLDGSI